MIGVIIFTLLGLISSIVFVNIDSYLDSKSVLEEEILKLLPGYDCGGCGFDKCSDLVKDILINTDNYLKCKPLKEEDKKEIEVYFKKNHYFFKDNK